MSLWNPEGWAAWGSYEDSQVHAQVGGLPRKKAKGGHTKGPQITCTSLQTGEESRTVQSSIFFSSRLDNREEDWNKSVLVVGAHGTRGLKSK